MPNDNLQVTMKVRIHGGFEDLMHNLQMVASRIDMTTARVSVYTYKGDRPYESDAHYLNITGDPK